jgi:hypothetical protein
MKSLLQLHLSVLSDLGRQCSIDIARDSKTVTCRCEDEGESFLTITLPAFSRALEKGLEQGYWPERNVVSNWKHHQGLPAFMRGFLLCVFDEQGRLRADPDVNCIRAIRQFCLLSQKIERECTANRVRSAFSGFVDTDSQLMFLPARLDKKRLSQFVDAAHVLFGDIFQRCDLLVAQYELIPRHGPGAVAERLSQRDKRNYSYWTDRLESVFPKWRYTVNTGYVSGHAVAPDSEIPVRVITVPKTQSTPRIIAIEPSSVQYAQQGLKRELYELIGRGPLRKVLGFQDQTRNQKMAKHASLTREFATLDLSEASDRVHWFLIYKMLERYPHLWDYVNATRSFRADVSGFGVLPLQKFASMGSALTFPMEAIVFTTLAALGLQESGAIPVITSPDFELFKLIGRLSVYGDDIIVPVRAVDAVIDWLEHFGAVVNRRKSFWNGRFRESCGAEYYNGHDVTVVRIRAELPSSRHDAANIAACIDLRNRMYFAGMWGVVRDLDKELESLIDVPYVHVSSFDQSGFLSRVTSLNKMPLPNGARFNPNLQRYEFKVPVLIPHGRVYRVDGEAGLLEWFHSSLRRSDLLDRYDSEERATSFSIQRRWQPVSIRAGWAD